MLLMVLLFVGSYLLGSVPTANIVSRTLKGVDLRSFGSKSVTSSNAGQLLGRRIQTVVGILDIMKGGIAVWAAQALGFGVHVQMMAGAWAITGHNWSIFLRFAGGRGLATAIGVVLGAAPWQLIPFVSFALGTVLLFKNVPLMMGIAMLLVPVWGVIWKQDPAYILGTSGIVLLLITKRLAGNGRTGPAEDGARVYLYRLLYDRDIKNRDEWVRRGASGQKA